MIISPALESDTKAIHSLFLAEGDRAGKTSWYRYLNHRRRTEWWDKVVVEGELLGFVHWAMKVDNTRTIYDLVVVRNRRHEGYGRALLKHVGTPVATKLSHDFLTHLGFRDGYLLKEPVLRDFTKPWILTYTGKDVNPLDIQPEEICIQDIAHALACVNRFAGHVAKPISVAQHSVYVSRLCDGDPSDHACPAGCEICAARRLVCLQALLHDASEAYLGDVTKWLKAEMPAYQKAEERAQTTILKKFGCAPVICEQVWRADRVMVMFEATKGFGKAWDGLHLAQRPGYEPITMVESAYIGKWSPWNWRQAEEAFLVRYRACTAK